MTPKYVAQQVLEVVRPLVSNPVSIGGSGDKFTKFACCVVEEILPKRWYRRGQYRILFASQLWTPGVAIYDRPGGVLDLAICPVLQRLSDQEGYHIPIEYIEN
jgi:hypothetical protein